MEVLLQRFSILRNGVESTPSNVIERAVDLHATRVIGSSGYQKCIGYLWKGWLAQDLEDPTRFCGYKNVANKSFWAHFDHDRIRAPKFQNAFQVLISFFYLGLYTVAINTINPRAISMSSRAYSTSSPWRLSPTSLQSSGRLAGST